MSSSNEKNSFMLKWNRLFSRDKHMPSWRSGVVQPHSRTGI
ncbi:hypothetical protein [Pseudobacillus wudalianchiensis]|nr:hypothetical protein [Bacillus wudalianchiensis]